MARLGAGICISENSQPGDNMMSRVVMAKEGTWNAAHEWRVVAGRGQHRLLVGRDVPPAEREVKEIEGPEQN